jgi:hypothetical protein
MGSSPRPDPVPASKFASGDLSTLESPLKHERTCGLGDDGDVLDVADGEMATFFAGPTRLPGNGLNDVLTGLVNFGLGGGVEDGPEGRLIPLLFPFGDLGGELPVFELVPDPVGDTAGDLAGDPLFDARLGLRTGLVGILVPGPGDAGGVVRISGFGKAAGGLLGELP